MIEIEKKGIRVTPDHLKLSKRATVSMPWHKVQDELEENRLAKTGSAFGSTRRGIAYAYSDKYRKKTLHLDVKYQRGEDLKRICPGWLPLCDLHCFRPGSGQPHLPALQEDRSHVLFLHRPS